MQTIADACGVSRNAVSIAIRGGKKGVSEETAKRIRAKAEELGYVPDPELSRLARRLGRARNHEGIKAEIPFVVPLPQGQPKGTSDFFLKICEAYALKNGYGLRPYSTGPEHYSVDRVQQIWESRGVQGVFIFNPFDGDWSQTGEFDWNRFSWVTFSETVHNPMLHRLNWDFRAALDVCFSKLREKGYQRIGLVMQHRYDEVISHAGLSANALHWDRVPSRERIPWLRHLYMLNTPEGEQELSAWLKTAKPDAIIGHKDCLPVLKKLSLRVPEHLAFACWRLQEPLVGQVAGILPAFATMGRVAVDMLVGQMEHQVRGVPENPILTLIEGDWNEGETAPAKE